MAIAKPLELLTVRDISRLAQLHVNTVHSELANPKSLLRKNGAALLRGRWRVPVEAYNAWVQAGKV